MVMSVVDLIKAGSLDAHLAAVCWVMIERRCPILVAASPRLAGKTTVLNALLAFLPEDEITVSLRGMDETFVFLKHSDPAHTCIVCNEISEDLRYYLWGPKVMTLFETLSMGYTLGTTIHADSAAEVASILKYNLSVPPALLARLGLVVTLGLRRSPEGVVRWVRGVDTLVSAGTSGPVVVPVYRRNSLEGSGIHELSTGSAAEDLSLKAKLPTSLFVKEVVQRESFLASLTAMGTRDYADVRDAIVAYARF